LPMFLVCPPITTTAIVHASIDRNETVRERRNGDQKDKD